MILPSDSPDAEIVLAHDTGKQAALGRVLVALSAVAWSTAGIFTKGVEAGCMDRAAMARAPGRRSDVGLAGVASRSGRARGLEASGLGGMVGRNRQQCGDHLLHSAPGFCNGGKSCHSHLPATKMCVETMPKNPDLTGENP